MKKNRGFLRATGLAAACAAVLVTASVAIDAGTDRDPLVTLSYLNDKFMSDVMKQVDNKIAQRDQKLAQQGVGSAAASSFTVVELSNGRILKTDIGCEVMLRVGSAVCVADTNPGLVDETDGTALGGGGKLLQNHMYMATIEGRGVKATADTVKVLVRGGYTIA